MSDNPYDRPSDPAKRHSAALTDGPDRAPARAMLKGTGFTDEDLARPLIGVATSWIETMPCNLNQRALARLDLPGLALYNGSIAPGSYKGADVTIQDVFEAVGAIEPL